MVSTDTSFEQRLSTLYAVPVPTELDRRIKTAITTSPAHRWGRTRPRVLAALAVAAILIFAAAGPALEWFGGSDDPFDQLWAVSTPVDQSVTDDGYRVTVHRAYADPLGVRLAMTVEDLEGRWSSLQVEGAELTDSRGRVYEGWNWSGNRTPVDGAIATWARFLLPDDAGGDDLRLQATVTSLWVRSPDPIPLDPDPDQIFRSVAGAWSFEFDMPPLTQGHAISPASNVSANGVTIDLAELGVVPSGTMVHLVVGGLPELPAENVEGWLPDISIEHDGVAMDGDQPLEPGVVGSDGVVTIEANPAVEELAGHWRITVHSFYPHITSPEPAWDWQFPLPEGPWVLEFDVAETP